MTNKAQDSFAGRLLKSRYADRLAGVIKHWPEVLLSFASFARFLCLRLERKTVLLVEPNAFHGVVLPGFYKYFQDLGYDVVLLCRLANLRDDVFCRCVAKPRVFVFAPMLMRWALRTRKIGCFDFVLFTSNQFFDQGVRFWGEYIGYLKFSPKPRYGVLSVEHDFIPDRPSYLTDIRNVFLLTPRTYNGTTVPMLNPHYFGDIKHTPLSQGTRVFIAVGAVSAKQCALPLLIDAVRQLEKKFEFEVWLIGKGADSSLMESLPASIRTFGYLPFEDMFQRMEDADFMLPLLDPSNDDHSHYLRGVTSAACLLILGFRKVPLIHNAFAAVYGFSESDSILHGDGGFAQAMEKALTMTNGEYGDLQQGIQRLAGKVYGESLENLRKRVEERCSASC
ncbi:MAG: glycosyltransferase family protein [Desulfobulbaceae bacterium]